MKIILEAIVESLNTRSDNSVVVKLSTREIDSSKAGELFQLRNRECKVLISDSNISTLEAELVDNTSLVSSKKKTPSGRLRAVLYVWHEQSGSEIDFEQFYASEMEKLINHFKSKLI